jgi:hypothetical protein
MSLPESEGAGPQPADWGLWIDRVLGLVAAALLFGLMMLTAVDVVSRYIFNWPLRGAFELTELGLLVLIFAGLPLASRRGELISGAAWSSCWSGCWCSGWPGRSG